jgi:hypothetical protein
MSERRTLVEGLTAPDPEAEKQFVYRGKLPAVAPPAPTQSAPAQPAPVAAQLVDRLPLTTRLRADLVTALKRASLERRLRGIEPSALQEILEQALEPWLRSNGHLP